MFVDVLRFDLPREDLRRGALDRGDHVVLRGVGHAEVEDRAGVVGGHGFGFVDGFSDGGREEVRAAEDVEFDAVFVEEVAG